MASRGVPHRDVPECFGSAPCAGCLWREGCEGLRERPRGAHDALAGRLRENVAVAAILRLVEGDENGPESREKPSGGRETT